MKLFIAILPILVALANSEPAVDATVNREGRILAAYERDTAYNTAKSVAKLQTVDQSLGSLRSEINNLYNTQSSVGQSVVSNLSTVRDALLKNGQLVQAIREVERLVNIAYNSTFLPSEDSFASLMTEFTTNLDGRLRNLEKTIGFDNYPSSSF